MAKYSNSKIPILNLRGMANMIIDIANEKRTPVAYWLAAQACQAVADALTRKAAKPWAERAEQALQAAQAVEKAMSDNLACQT